MPVYRRNGRAVLFIHVPKTGGTSVEQLFKASGWEPAYLDTKVGPGSLNYLSWCSPQHLHGTLLQSLLRLDRFDLVFTVVRDPVARFRSEYVWRTRKRDDVSTGADAVNKWLLKSMASYRKNPYLYDNHFRPQHEFLVPGTTVLKLEDGLAEALKDLSDTHDLGLEGEPERFRDSQTNSRKSRDVEVSTGTKLLLRKLYKKDFSTFGYPRP
jgi:hypothetical protein